MGSGMSLDAVLDMTFDQIQLSATCIVKVKVDFLNSIVEPLMGAFGAEYKPASTDGPAKSASKKKSSMTDDEKKTAEKNKLMGLAQMGIPVL
jgi:hypothetical protein